MASYIPPYGTLYNFNLGDYIYSQSNYPQRIQTYPQRVSVGLPEIDYTPKSYLLTPRFVDNETITPNPNDFAGFDNSGKLLYDSNQGYFTADSGDPLKNTKWDINNINDDPLKLSKHGSFSNGSGFSPNKAANIAKSGIGLATAIADDIGSAVRANRSQVTPLKFTYNTDGYNTFSDLTNFRKNELSYSTLEKPNKGAQTGDVFKRFGRGAASGASLGASIGGPWGAAIGAIAGAVGGLGSGIAKALTENSRYRKDISKTNKLNRFYNNQFNEATADILSNINIKNANAMNRQRLYNTFAEGGNMSAGDNFGVTQFNSGGSHEENPNNGVQQGVDANGQPNLVEEGEVRWNDFIFSNRIKPQQDVLSKFNSRMNKEFVSYADIANKILDMHKERENNPFDKSTLDIQMQRLADAQEYQKLSEEAAENGITPEEYIQYVQQMQQSNMFKEGGDIPHSHSTGGTYKNIKNNPFLKEGAYQIDNWLKYYDQFLARHEDGQELDSNEKYNMDWAERQARKEMQKYPELQYYLAQRMSELYDWGREQVQQATDEFLQRNGVPKVEASLPWKWNNNKVNNPRPSSGYYSPVRGTMQVYDTSEYNNDLGFIDPLKNPTYGLNQSDMIANTNNTQMANVAIPTTSLNFNYSGYSGGSSQPQVRYWDAKLQDYVDYDENNPNLYAISGRGGTGYDGRIDYSKNPNYVKIHSAFNDDDWNAIKDALIAKDPKYKNYSIDQIKKGANDNLFGNIHKAILNRVALKNAEENNQPEEKQLEIPADNKPATTETTTATTTDDNTTTTTTPTKYTHPYYADLLRFAPVFDSLRQVLTQNNPDYTYAKQIASLYRPASYRPVGQYQRYQPIDQYYGATQANNQMNTLYGFYKNNSIGAGSTNAYATMAANLGKSAAIDAYINAINTNNQQRNAALAYNNQIDATNEANRMQVEQNNLQNYANIMGNSYAAAEEERLAVENAREANKQNLAENLGLIGKEWLDRYYVTSNPALLYSAFGEKFKK
jgi:outer membrane lipoprotein SlyB